MSSKRIQVVTTLTQVLQHGLSNDEVHLGGVVAFTHRIRSAKIASVGKSKLIVGLALARGYKYPVDVVSHPWRLIPKS